MFGECHAHLMMDGANYAAAVQLHREQVNIPQVRKYLREYQNHGITFLRDGGDALGVSEKARELAGEYGIDYRSPLFAIHKKGHYGKIVGRQFEDMGEYRRLVEEVRARRGDFIKIMVSGIMDYRGWGILSEESLPEREIREMIHIAHEEGFAVMVHGNGPQGVLAAVLAGADSMEHGNYIDRDCIEAMADRGCVWVPTIATTGNLLECQRYDRKVLEGIYHTERETLAAAYEAGVSLALGSDAGAYLVEHGKSLEQEYTIFCRTILGRGGDSEKKDRLDAWLRDGEEKIRCKFHG